MGTSLRAQPALLALNLARHVRCRRLAGVRRPVLFVDGGPNISDRGSRGMQLHRVTRDAKAERSSHAVAIPTGDSALTVPRRDEAVMVRAMSVVFAPAEAGDVPQYFRMARGKFVHGAHDLRRPDHV